MEYDVIGVDGNRKLWDNYVLTDKTLWKLKELLNALDMDTSAIVELDVQELVGSQLQAKVIQETYNGEIVNRVKKVMPV